MTVRALAAWRCKASPIGAALPSTRTRPAVSTSGADMTFFLDNGATGSSLESSSSLQFQKKKSIVSERVTVIRCLISSVYTYLYAAMRSISKLSKGNLNPGF